MRGEAVSGAQLRFYDLEQPDVLVHQLQSGRLDDVRSLLGEDAFAALSDAGKLSLAASLSLEGFDWQAEHWYLVTLQQGDLVDADQDGVVDSTPQAFSGTYHTLVSGQELRAGRIGFNPLADFLYQLHHYLIGANVVFEDWQALLDDQARLLLNQDLNGDQHINYRDVLLFSTREHSGRSRLASGLISDYRTAVNSGSALDAILLDLRGAEQQRFAVIGHLFPLLFDSGAEGPAVLTTLLQNAEPETVFLTGDVIPGSYIRDIDLGEPYPQTYLANPLAYLAYDDQDELQQEIVRQWNLVSDFFAALGMAYYVAPGNHDVGSYAAENRVTIRQQTSSILGGLDRHLSMNGLEFVLLSSIYQDVDYYLPAYLSDAQMRWLGDILDQAQDNSVYVFVHNPLWFNAPLSAFPGNFFRASDWHLRLSDAQLGKMAAVYSGDCGSLYASYLRGVMHYCFGATNQRARLLNVVRGASFNSISYEEVPLAAR